MMLPGANRDRWLLSYADFVTLLFAVFVMMYAMEKTRDRQHTTSVVSQPAMPVASPQTPPTPQTLLNEIETNLADERRTGFLTVSTGSRGVVIALNDQTLFRPGEAGVQPSVEATFDRIGRLLSGYPNHILLEGHTDSVPIHNDHFRSNWELSTARSMAVMELLERHSSIPASRFSIGGSADNAPVSTDNSEAGRALNRRVDIVVLEAALPVTGRPSRQL